MTTQYTIVARTECRETQATLIDKVRRFVQARPDAEVVTESGQPPTLVIKAAPSAKTAIEQAFGPDVVIEGDELLGY